MGCASMEGGKRDQRAVVLAGPRHSGKTTALLSWSLANGQTVRGFVADVAPQTGLKVLVDLESREETALEMSEAGTDTLEVGLKPYYLSLSCFARANAILDRALISQPGRDGIFVLDELGPLEVTRSEGHHNLVVRLLSEWTGRILLVVREELLEAALTKYDCKGAKVVTVADLAMLSLTH